jgi:hypothetical protein
VSVYAVHKIAQFLRKDRSFVERAAILSGNVGRLAARGAHAYLMGIFAQQQVVGVTMANYVERTHEACG